MSLLSCLVLSCLSARTAFDDIVAKKSPAEVVFEDDATLAFRDLNPVAPTQYVSAYAPATANCTIIDHFSAFELGLVAPFLYAA